MPRWNLGDVRITAVSEKDLMVTGADFLIGSSQADLDAMSWLGEPYLTAEGMVRMTVRAFVIETPETRIIVDTCFGNDKRRQWEPGHRLQTNFLARLEAEAAPRETVDVVLCTHMHVDHVGWNTMLVDGRWAPTFPNARYLFARTEFEHWREEGDFDQDAIFADSIKPVIDAGLVDIVEPDHRVDSHVRLVPSPGHTLGHVWVEITAGDARWLITGDSIHSPAQIARPDWTMYADWDKATAAATRRLMIDAFADTPNQLLGTHFPDPAAGKVVRTAEGCRFVPDPSES